MCKSNTFLQIEAEMHGEADKIGIEVPSDYR